MKLLSPLHAFHVGLWVGVLVGFCLAAWLVGHQVDKQLDDVVIYEPEPTQVEAGAPSVPLGPPMPPRAVAYTSRVSAARAARSRP